MFRSLAFAGLLTASCAVHAVPVWNFSYTGFLEQNTGLFSKTYSLKGSFSGQDENRDGYLEKDEITAFFLNGVDYIGCAGSSNEYYHCGTDYFRYKIGGKLDFAAGQGGGDPEGYTGGGHYFTAGLQEQEFHYTPSSYQENVYLWTDETRFRITKNRGHGVPMGAQVLAVPEPGTWMMLATGLLLVAGAAKRRQPAPAIRG